MKTFFSLHLARGTCITFFALLALSAHSGCTGDGSEEAAAVQSCELLTAAEAEEIIGAPVDMPPRATHKVDEDGIFWMSMCNYYAPETGISMGIMVQPLPQAAKSPEEAQKMHLKSLRESLGEYVVTPVSDVGDTAFWDASTGQLTLFTDRHMLIVTAMKPQSSSDEKLSLALRAADKAVAALQQ